VVALAQRGKHGGIGYLCLWLTIACVRLGYACPAFLGNVGWWVGFFVGWRGVTMVALAMAMATMMSVSPLVRAATTTATTTQR